MTKQDVLDKILRAATLEEIEKADKAAKEWLRQHPHDTAVLSASEQLAMLEDVLRAKR